MCINAIVPLIYIAGSEINEKYKKWAFRSISASNSSFWFFSLLFVVLEKQVIVIHKWVILTKQFNYPQKHSHILFTNYRIYYGIINKILLFIQFLNLKFISNWIFSRKIIVNALCIWIFSTTSYGSNKKSSF